MPSEGYRCLAWRTAQDGESYVDDEVIATAVGTQDQYIMLNDLDKVID